MSSEFTREERYIVFKLSDLGNSLKGDEIRKLAEEYAEQRRLKGKEPLKCVVVESDWPEYEPTWKAIEARVTGAQPAPSAPVGLITDYFVSISDHVAHQEEPKTQAEIGDLLRMLAAIPCAQPAPSVPVAALRPVIDWLRNGCEPQEAAKELELLIGVAPEANRAS